MKTKPAFFVTLFLTLIPFLGPTLYGTELHCDVAVYSGNPCGVAAAVTAARSGAKVILIEPTRHIGGLTTSGINTAETEHMLTWTIGGFALEFYRAMGTEYGTGKPEFYFESSVAERVMLRLLREAGVEIIFDSHLQKVILENARIRQVTLSDGSRLIAREFVDASYEGDLMAAAGVTFSIGREAREDFDEEAAGIRFDPVPQQAATMDENGRLLPGISAWKKDFIAGARDPGVMNYNFRLTVTDDPAFRIPFPSPRHYERRKFELLENWLATKAARHEPVVLRDILDFYARRNHKFELNNKQSAIISLGCFGEQFQWPDASFEERERIYEAHKDYTLGLLYFLANEPVVPLSVRTEMQRWGLHAGEFKDNGYFPYQLYVREARRMRGALVVTQGDVTTNRHKPDTIGMSSHFIDCHHVQRLAVSKSAFVNEGRIWRRGYAYQIPYRALVPGGQSCINLIVPCAASFTHVAYCTLRLESVWMITGHAAGVAAALAAVDNQPVQSVDVSILQSKLREQNQVIDFVAGQPEHADQLNGPPEF